MIACNVSPWVGSSTVEGDSLPLKRDEARATSPSQCPDARAWLTIRAQADASAVRTHGAALPSTHTLSPEPNIATRSDSSKLTSGYVDAGKFGKDQPSVAV